MKDTKVPIKKARESYKESLVLLKKYYEISSEFIDLIESEIFENEDEMVKSYPDFRSKINEKEVKDEIEYSLGTDKSIEAIEGPFGRIIPTKIDD